MLKYKNIFLIKYTEAILSNSTWKLLWFEITRMLTAVLKNKFTVSFIIIFGTLSFPISASIPSGLRWERATASEWLPFPCTPTVRADTTMQSLHQSRASLDNTATTQPSRPRGPVRHCSTQHSLSTHHLYTQSALTFWSFLPRDAMLARKLFLQTKDEKQNSQFLIKSHYFNG